MAAGEKAALDREFAEFKHDRVKVRCFACKLPSDLRTWVDSNLANGAGSAEVAEFLTKKGHKVGTSAIVSHRRAHVPDAG